MDLSLQPRPVCINRSIRSPASSWQLQAHMQGLHPSANTINSMCKREEQNSVAITFGTMLGMNVSMDEGISIDSLNPGLRSLSPFQSEVL